MNTGKYIVIEGLANYRTEILQLLANQLTGAQLPVKIFREPESQNDLTARAINRLTHDPRYPMTSRTEVLLYNAARIQSLQTIRAALENGLVCLVDRSYLTTLAVQYYGYGDIEDYQKINDIIDFAVDGLQPDLTVVLDTPIAELDKAVSAKFLIGRSETDANAFLERVRAGYLWEAKQRNMPVVYATGDIDHVFKEVWQHVADVLAVRTKPSQPESVKDVLATKAAATAEPPVIVNSEGQSKKDSASENNEAWTQKHENGSISITPAGKAKLAEVVTNTEGSVYTFTENTSPVTIAAAMARLSRRGDDMRVTLLDEFIGKVEKDEQLLHRVITAYGDDSVQQLVGQHFVVEGASILLTKKLERGRLASYLEQSSRYIYFDQKDSNGHYRYYVPPELKGKIRSQYIRTMNQLFDIYSDLVQKMTEHVRATSSVPKAEQDGAWRSATKAQACDAIRDLLPLSTKATVGIFASGQAIESLIMHLLGDELMEAQQTGQEMLAEGRKVIPVFLERADKPDRGGATIAYRSFTRKAVRELADKLLPAHHTSAATEPATLVSFTPRNELDIVADILYEYSDQSLESLQETVTSWPYQRKVDVFKAYMGERLNRRHRPGRALEKIHYSFDLVGKYGTFKDLQRHRIVDDLQWQEFTPRLGYDVPKLVEEAGLSDQYEQCFDISLELYSALQASVGPIVAQYAVLHGHHVRWKVTINGREAFQKLELRSSPQGHPAYRKLAQQMHAAIADVHPMLAEAMTFMNQGEDEELTRLAAEKYTQYKLTQLDTPS